MSLSTPWPSSSTPSTPISSPVLDHPEVDNGNCRLLGPFALIVQGLMGIMVLGTLVWKRQRESPRRPWKIWILDITKQMLGQLFVHILNVALSTLVAHVGEQNPCSLYFLNVLIDTTLGVFIIYITLRVITHILTDVWGLRGFVSGRYTDRASKRSSGGSSARNKRGPNLNYWLRQLATYFFALLVMKLIVTILFALFPFLFTLGRWMLSLFGEARNLQVLFVMCLFPLAMNTLQFWLVDSLLRHDPNKSKYASVRIGQGDHGNIGSANSSGVPAWDLDNTSASGNNESRNTSDRPYGSGDDEDSHSHLDDGLSEDEEEAQEEEEEQEEEVEERAEDAKHDARQAKLTAPRTLQSGQHRVDPAEEPSQPRLRCSPLNRDGSFLAVVGSEESAGSMHAYPPSDTMTATTTAIGEREAEIKPASGSGNHGSRVTSRNSSPAGSKEQSDGRDAK